MVKKQGQVNIQRRAKRHVRAPEHPWFAVCSPGLEPVVAKELQAISSVREIQPARGGVAFRAKLEGAMEANVALRSATRVLMRLATFEAATPKGLRKGLDRIPWEALLPTDRPTALKCSRRGIPWSTRGRPEQVFYDGIQERFSGLGMVSPVSSKKVHGEKGKKSAEGDQGSDPGQKVFLRLQGSQVTVSLDSTGPILTQRGYRVHPWKAPLRESLAAGILLWAGYQGTEPLADPMCGSGTFCIEAALLASRQDPGATREFTFQHWPAYSEAAFRHMLQGRKVASSPDEAPPPAASIWGGDLRSGALEATRKNAEAAGVRELLKVAAGDFFLKEAPGEPGLVVMNPPLGRRLSLRGEGRGRPGAPASKNKGGVQKEWAEALGKRLKEAWPGWRYALVTPSKRWSGYLDLPVEDHLVLPHGGKKVYLLKGQLP